MRIALVCVIWLTACSGYDDLPLLDLEAVEPPQIEPGGTLRLYGHGFPLGRSAIVELRGSVHQPGTPSSPLVATLVGEVQSESLIEVPIEAALMRSIGGRATLDGELRLAFRAADDQRDVFAARAVQIDFLPDTSTQLRSLPAEDPDLAIGAREFGVELSREELGTVGVRVESVDPDGWAAIQGVRPGDTLVGLDGVRLYSWRDFAPDPSRTDSVVSVARSGLPGTHPLRWPHAATERRANPLALAIFALLGLLLGWLSPATLCFRKPLPSTSVQAVLTQASLVLVLSAALFCAAAIQWTTIWILVLGLLAALCTLAARQRTAAWSFAFAIFSTLTVMLLARTASISSIVAAQQSTPLHWYLFQTPASFLACGAYVYALGQVASQNRLSASLFSSVAAVLGAALFLGGWPSVDPLHGIVLLVAKAAAILSAARVFDMSRLTAITVSCLGLGLGLVGLLVDTGTLGPYWSALASGSFGAVALRAVIPSLRRQAAPTIA